MTHLFMEDIFIVGCARRAGNGGLSENQGLGIRGQGVGFRGQLTVRAHPRSLPQLVIPEVC